MAHTHKKVLIQAFIMFFGLSGFFSPRAESSMLSTLVGAGMYVSARTAIYVASRRVLNHVIPAGNTTSVLTVFKWCLIFGIDIATLLLLPRLLPSDSVSWLDSSPADQTSLIRKTVVCGVSLVTFAAGAVCIRKGNGSVQRGFDSFSQAMEACATVYGGMTCCLLGDVLMKMHVGFLPSKLMEIWLLTFSGQNGF